MALTNSQTIPNQAQPGTLGSRFTGFLRSSPAVSTVITAGQGNQDFVIASYPLPVLPERHLYSRSYSGAGSPSAKYGEARTNIVAQVTTAGNPFAASVSRTLTVSITTGGVVPTVAAQQYPSPFFAVAFGDEPLGPWPAWNNLSMRSRGLTTTRGRSYEFDRMETGTTKAILDNRDSALNPENTASPYTPIRSTRPLLVQAVWGTTVYPVFRGISEGFPQAYPSLGLDALVELNGNDMFYALNNAKFAPGITTLITALTVVDQNTEQTITVGGTGLSLPQAPPFTITVAGLTSDWPSEEMEVTEIVSATEWLVTRSAEDRYEHPVGAEITTNTVSFAEEPSGVRIQNVLLMAGIPSKVFPWPNEVINSNWWDIDTGQSTIAASGDLSQVSPLEHINLIAETEFGRFFVSREGKFTFRDRHSVILDQLAEAFTFRDAITTGTEVPYSISGALEHSEEKLYNRVKITIPTGEVVDVSDAASIVQHFERIFERELPYANLNDAVSAANFVLARQSEDTLRIPEIIVHGANDPSRLWPLLLAREIGDRVRFRMQPEGGGDELDKDMVIEGISHRMAPKQHAMSFHCTEVDANNYWILGMTGYSELGQTTWVAF